MKQHHQHLKNHHLDAWLARSVVILIAALQLAFVNDLSVGGTWLAPAIELALLIRLSIGTVWTQRTVRRAQSSNEWHLVRRPRRFVRGLATVLTAFSTLINLVALVLLIKAIVQGKAGSGRALLIDAINIWTTNVVVFALWYWILDRGGPSSRGMVDDETRDFLFTQQQEAIGAAGSFPNWLPGRRLCFFSLYECYRIFSGRHLSAIDARQAFDDGRIDDFTRYDRSCGFPSSRDTHVAIYDA